jgi:hypothetical protein
MKHCSLPQSRQLQLGLSALALALSFGVAARPQGARGPSGYWRGTGHTRRSTDLKWVTLIHAHDSEFWFTVDSQGNVDGQAVVRYDVKLNDQKLSSYLGWAHRVGNAALFNNIPGFGGLLGAGASLQDLSGMRLSYDEVMPVRSGRIRGNLSGGKLHLAWAAPPRELPYKTYRLYPTKELVISSKEAPAYTPWGVDAVVSEPAPGHWQAMVPAAESLKKQGDADTAVQWTAYRVSLPE